MAVEWFDNIFKEKQDANQRRQQDEAYENKKRQIEKNTEEIERQYERTQEKQRKIIEQLHRDSSA